MPFPIPLFAPRRERNVGYPYGQPLPLTGQLVWYAANTESYSDGDAVGTLNDRSGNGRNATQATAGYKPTFKTNILNGLPGILFDGSNDRLEMPTTVAITDPITLIAVLQTVTLPASGHFAFIWHLNDTTGNEGVWLGDAPAGYHAFQGYDASVYQFSLVTHSRITCNTILVGRASSGAASLFACGGLASYTTSNAMNISATNYVRLGCEAYGSPVTEDEFWNGYLFEFSVFNRSLTLGEVYAWSDYLKNKYNLPSS
jgi:hypothetical protein